MHLSLVSWFSGGADNIVSVQLFAVAIKRASKCAAWATQYAQLCSHLKAAGAGPAQTATVDSAVRGRATAEYCRLSTHTVSLTPQGAPKSPEQVGLLTRQIRSDKFTLFQPHQADQMLDPQ